MSEALAGTGDSSSGLLITRDGGNLCHHPSRLLSTSSPVFPSSMAKGNHCSVNGRISVVPPQSVSSPTIHILVTMDVSIRVCFHQCFTTSRLRQGKSHPINPSPSCAPQSFLPYSHLSISRIQSLSQPFKLLSTLIKSQSISIKVPSSHDPTPTPPQEPTSQTKKCHQTPGPTSTPVPNKPANLEPSTSSYRQVVINLPLSNLLLFILDGVDSLNRLSSLSSKVMGDGEQEHSNSRVASKLAERGSGVGRGSSGVGHLGGRELMREM